MAKGGNKGKLTKLSVAEEGRGRKERGRHGKGVIRLEMITKRQRRKLDESNTGNTR